jgi:hypothetical protein
MQKYYVSYTYLKTSRRGVYRVYKSEITELYPVDFIRKKQNAVILYSCPVLNPVGVDSIKNEIQERIDADTKEKTVNNVTDKFNGKVSIEDSKEAK